MPVVLLRLPKTKTVPNGRPKHCPNCGSQILQRWGRVTKSVQGRTDILAVIYRYRCGDCEKTFRYYPEGVDRSSHTHSIRKLAAVLSALGLSYRQIEEIFEEFGINLSHTTVWREGQELVNQLNGAKIAYYLHKFTIDRTYVHNISSKFGVVIALDMGSGKYNVLGALNEHNPTSVLAWLRPLVEGTGIQAIKLGTGRLDYLN